MTLQGIDIANLSKIDKAIIKSIHLFSELTESELDGLLASSLLREVPSGAHLLTEGEESQGIYVILEGKVEVYTKKPSGDILTLAILSTGDVVGEDALSHTPPFPRSASVIALENLKVTEIPASALKKFITKYSHFRKKLSLHRSMHLYDRMLKLNTQLQSLKVTSEDLKHIHEETYQANSIIFSAGNEGDALYVILAGQVRVQNKYGSEEKVIAKLGVGQLFGELALLENQPRAATVIAEQTVKVLRIDKELFIKWYSLDPTFRSVLNSLKNIYHLQDDSLITTFSGKHEGKNCISTIRERSNGDVFISIQMIDEETVLFNKIVKDETDKVEQLTYKSSKGDIKIELRLLNDKIIGVTTYALWADLSYVVSLIINGETISHWKKDLFSKYGKFNLESPAELVFNKTMLCKCMQISYGDFAKTIAKYGNDPGRVIQATGVTLVCDACLLVVNDLLGKTDYINLKISDTKKLTGNIFAIKLTSLDKKLPSFEAGQHIIIMVKLGDEWVQRSYTITEQIDEHTWEIIVLHQSSGLMSPLLTSAHTQDLQIKSTEPRGLFTIAPDSSSVVFFASGIGVVPALAFLRKKTPGFFLHYSATKEEFIYKDIIEKHSNVILHDTSKQGDLTFQEIKTILEAHPNANIMICGPEGFNKLLLEACKHLKISDEKIKCESFSPDKYQKRKNMAYSHGSLIPYFAPKNATEIELFLNDVYTHLGLLSIYFTRVEMVRLEVKNKGFFVPTSDEVSIGIKNIFLHHQININNLHVLDKRTILPSADTDQIERIFEDHQSLADISPENIVVTILPEKMVLPSAYTAITIELTRYCTLNAIIKLPKDISIDLPLRYQVIHKNIEAIPRALPKQEKWPIIGVFFRIKDILFRPIEMVLDAVKEYGYPFKIKARPGLSIFILGPKPYHDLLDIRPEIARRGPIMMVVPTIAFWFKRTNMKSAEWMQSLLLSTRSYIAERLVGPNQLNKMSPIIHDIVKQHVEKWDNKINLSTDLIKLIYDASISCIVQRELWDDIKEEAMPLLRYIANSIDTTRAGIAITPFKIFLPEYHASKKIEKLLKKIVHEHRANIKTYPFLDMLAELEVDGKPLPEKDLAWFFIYVMWNSTIYPGTYGVWMLSKILTTPSVYNDLKKKNKKERQLLLDECFIETMRIFPVTLLARSLGCPVDFKTEKKTYRIPKNAWAGIFPYASCHDKKTYPEPEKFNPYRYALGEKIPETFGAGPFGCVAAQFSHLLLSTVMNELLTLLDFKLISEIEWPRSRIHPLYPNKPIWAEISKTKSEEPIA